jgi:putative ABC transport system ATP-binding protein
VIQARDVEFSYGDAPILQSVSLDVAPGEVVALVGPSGSGKSTFLYCLGGILRASAGRIAIGTTEIGSLSDAELSALRAAECGYVLQFGRLIGELSAMENVTIPLRLAGRPRAEAEARSLEALESVGVEMLAGRKAASLSGGEQQRVAVARAMVHRPKVVFADEPTGALDSSNGARVMDCLTSLARANETSLLLVTHDLGVAERADRLVRIRDGVITDGAAA